MNDTGGDLMQQLQSIEEFQEMIKNGKTVFLFSANWCPDCRVIEPFMPEVEAQYNEINFIYVDRDEFIDLCRDYDIFGIPSFLAFENGEEVSRFVSKDSKTRKEIETFLEEL